jgi:hypothetical protein
MVVVWRNDIGLRFLISLLCVVVQVLKTPQFSDDFFLRSGILHEFCVEKPFQAHAGQAIFTARDLYVRAPRRCLGNNEWRQLTALYPLRCWGCSLSKWNLRDGDSDDSLHDFSLLSSLTSLIRERSSSVVGGRHLFAYKSSIQARTDISFSISGWAPFQLEIDVDSDFWLYDFSLLLSLTSFIRERSSSVVGSRPLSAYKSSMQSCTDFSFSIYGWCLKI